MKKMSSLSQEITWTFIFEVAAGKVKVSSTTPGMGGHTCRPSTDVGVLVA